MDQSILELINKSGKFSEKESEQLQKELHYRKLKKDEFLLKTGQTCSSLCFIISGSFYHYKFDVNHKQIIIDLNISQEWMLNHKSFTARKPSEYSIQAFEDSSIYEISIDAIHKLIALSPSFLQLGKVFEKSTSRIDFFDNSYTPLEKYKFLLDNKAELLQKFPQKIIASYLKMTPETLSRVRKKISTL